MRKITREIVAAFMNREERRISNSYTDGTTLYLHGNAIARHRCDGDIEVTTAGWNTVTTRERLNGIPGVNVFVRGGQLYLNHYKWNGDWVSPVPYSTEEDRRRYGHQEVR
jgi:hypothetical protein